MARGFIGGQFGPSPVPSTARPANLSGMFSMDDSYYIHQNGGWAEPTGVIASGGMINDYPSGGNIYRAHVFLGSGTYTVSRQSNDPTIPSSQDVLVVGAGGAGATRTPGPGYSGGGGSGGVSEAPGKTLANGDYKIIIGAGGAPGGDTGSGLNGTDTFFGPPSPGSAGTSPPNGITCLGGGGGGSNSKGNPGGSGGGAGGNTSGPQQSSGTQPTVTQGIPGFTQYGNSGDYAGDGAQSAGGGGISGSGGQMHGPWGNFAGAGRNGRDWNWATGSNIHYGAGGGSQAGKTTPSRMSAGGGIDFPYPSAPVGGPFLPTAGDARSNWPQPAGHRPDPTVQYYPYGAVSPYNGWQGRGGGGAGMCKSPANPEGSPIVPSGIGGYGGSGSVIVRYKIATVQTGTAKASGGNISFYGGKCIHVFDTSGTFQVSNPTAIDVEYFMIGGGGGGGQGGGGAGGFLTATGAPVSPGSPNNVKVTIGSGGQGFASHPDPTPYNGQPGWDTILAGGIDARAAGGGGGQCDSADGTAASAEGGSGGGGKAGGEGGTGATYPEANYPTNPSAGGSAPGQGYAGGDGGPTADAYGGGGGGGAGGAGSAGTAPAGGNGGIGLQLPATFRNPEATYGAVGPNGENWWVGGGGGGGSRSPDYTTGEGGGPGGPYAGGGEGGTYPAKGQTAGASGTGAGGGGCAGPSAPTGPAEAGMQGGSGIVLIAYDV